MRNVNFLIATFFGIGRIPFAPGTWASLAAAPCFWPLLNYPRFHAAVLVLVYLVGVYASTQYEKQMAKKDPSSAVIDEVLGMGVAMFGIPVMVGVPQWPFVVMAIILFRLFDIWKPYPIRRLEKLPAGWGIMTDDLLAGIYAFAWVQLGIYAVNALR